MIFERPDSSILQLQCFLCHDRTGAGSLFCTPCWEDLLVDAPVCRRCGRGAGRKGLCAGCLKNPPAIDSALTLFPYRFPVPRLLHALKYKNQLMLARELGERLAHKILAFEYALPDYIVPVPLHPRRLCGRGYNQSLEIARAVSTLLGVPLRTTAARRIRNTRAQFSLLANERRQNLLGAFRTRGKAFTGPVVIIDDIITTGSTANELALQLKKAGATSVGLWACAHSA